MSKKQPPVCAPASTSPALQSVSDALGKVRASVERLNGARVLLAGASANHRDAVEAARAAMVAAGLRHVVQGGELVTVAGGTAGVETSLIFAPAPAVLS